MAGDFFEGKLTELYDEHTALLKQMSEDDQRRANSGAHSARLMSLMASIRNAPARIDDYHDPCTQEMVEQVRVMDAQSLLVTFKGGAEIEVEVMG